MGDDRDGRSLVGVAASRGDQRPHTLLSKQTLARRVSLSLLAGAVESRRRRIVCSSIGGEEKEDATERQKRQKQRWRRLCRRAQFSVLRFDRLPRWPFAAAAAAAAAAGARGIIARSAACRLSTASVVRSFVDYGRRPAYPVWTAK